VPQQLLDEAIVWLGHRARTFIAMIEDDPHGLTPEMAENPISSRSSTGCIAHNGFAIIQPRSPEANSSPLGRRLA